ncbi:MAG: hypothetical protein HWE34_05515 [Methylocystaceae bacterium]|nr:hypothetical protein [Methylocystaceae bacterium]
MINDTYEIKESFRSELSKKLRDKYSKYIRDARMGAFNSKTHKLAIVLFFYTDDMKDQAQSDGLTSEIQEFCLKELLQVELEELRTYGIQLICDSHENVVRTNGGNYLMYRR